MIQNSYNDTATLYLIPTPIGNLDDITYRGVKVLQEVDVIFSEDTRVTASLLEYLHIKKKLIALHDHNEELVKEKVIEFLKEGKLVALVTDRGTPIISDPGFKTVKFAIDSGYNVVSLPGATAFVITVSDTLTGAISASIWKPKAAAWAARPAWTLPSPALNTACTNAGSYLT